MIYSGSFISFSVMFPRVIHVVTYQYLISFYCQIVFYSIAWICHFLLISFISWQKFGLFHFLTTMNSTCFKHPYTGFMWTWVFISLGYIPRKALLSDLITLPLTFWGTAKTFFKAIVPFYAPTSNISKHSIWPTPTSPLGDCLSFHFSHPVPLSDIDRKSVV